MNSKKKPLDLNPNSCSDIVYFPLVPDEFTDFILEIISLDGNVAKSVKNVSSMDISDLDPGVYIAKLSGLNDSKMRLLIKD